jgi:hypothetical protein
VTSQNKIQELYLICIYISESYAIVRSYSTTHDSSIVNPEDYIIGQNALQVMWEGTLLRTHLDEYDAINDLS